jgi:hypothetical protein
MANAKNILVGAARVYTSYGVGGSRPDLSSSVTFPWNVNVATNSAASTAASVSTPTFLGTTASSYWRDMGFTSNGVEVSYEPSYSDVTVDQLLDAARLFQTALKITLKTEVNEATFENMNVVFGQSELTLNAGSAFAQVPTVYTTGTTASTGTITQINLLGGALGVAPQERTLVLVGNAPGSFGNTSTFGSASGTTGAATFGTGLIDASTIRSKERVYVARRAVQTDTTAHSLKRDSVTVFPVSFRCLPDTDRNPAAGSEYGFIVDRIYGTV